MTDPVSGRSLANEVFDEWPAVVRAWFDGTALANKTGFTVSLLTSDAQGYVRTSLLGVGELYAPDSRRLCVALWPGSRAAAVLAQSGRATLTFVCEDAFYQVQMRFEPLERAVGEIGGAARGLVYFAGLIDTGETQRVRYARLTGGITFELAEGREAVLDRWEQQIEHLKQAAAAAQR
jgi:hypothetical protein